MKLEVTGSPSGPSRKVTVCAPSAPQALDQLADRLGLAVWPRPDRPASRARLLRWHREGGALLEHLRGRANRQHVLALGLIEAIAQPGVLPIGLIAEHRRPRNIPARGALDQLDPELRLGLERDLVRDLRLAPPLRVRAPVLRQIQRPPQRHRPPRADRVHRHADLTVTPLAQRPRVLALDTRRVLAVLRETRCHPTPTPRRRSAAPPAPPPP